MRFRDWNARQRIVVVIGLGIALYFFGGWITTRDTVTGWVAYAPLSNSVNFPGAGLPPWARLLIWLALILVWMVSSLALLRTAAGSDES